MSHEELLATMKKIGEIALSAAPKITDVSAREQVERIAGLAESALNKPRAKPGKE